MSVVERETRKGVLPDWLRAPKSDSPDGTMALVDHLRELRYRVIISFIAFVVVLIVAFIIENTTHLLTDLMTQPILAAKDAYLLKYPDREVILSTDGIMGGFTLQVKVAAVAGLIFSCPIWIWQLWSFIVPGLLSNEKKYTLRFMGAAIPLFLFGVAVGYLVLPKGFEVMMGFNPPGTTNINEMNNYLSFELRMLLVFGLSFLLPVVLVALNLLGVVKATQLSKSRVVAIFVCFIFGAIATPSTDPISMLALAVPMALMYLISEVICHIHDRSVAKKLEEGGGDVVVKIGEPDFE
ncbi:twin-arginine translocase subunit TatC [Propionibacteriaceae bacterium G1746]|uniref:twin-arginine translocase subunit TatC n=1 Tax=Aestuariimicrobium sp. G57 TaxID=3418485 RepID=UPI003C1FC732